MNADNLTALAASPSFVLLFYEFQNTEFADAG
jgi:hypothetical protein